MLDDLRGVRATPVSRQLRRLRAWARALSDIELDPRHRKGEPLRHAPRRAKHRAIEIRRAA